MFTTPLDHLNAELTRLDLLIHRQMLRLRAAYDLSLDEFRGLYVSDEHVDALVNQALDQQQGGLDTAALTERAEALRRHHAAEIEEALPWTHLITAFALSRFEQDVLLMALAPEIDLKYEMLYAYLNNNVNRKWPTFDLALRMMADEGGEKKPLRRLLMPDATLLGSGILRPLKPAQERPSWLATGFAAAPSVVRFVLGFSAHETAYASLWRREKPADGWDALPQVGALVDSLRRAAELYQAAAQDPVVLVFEGRAGSGRAQAAGAVCRALGLSLLRVDGEALHAGSETLPEALQALALGQRLEPAGIFVERVEAMVGNDGRPSPAARRAVARLGQMPGPLMLACTPETPWRALLNDRRVLVFRFGEVGYDERRRLWETGVDRHGGTLPAPVFDALADRFVLNPGQINRVIAAARDAQYVRGEEALSSEALFEAARAESGRRLGKLAAKVKTIHTWTDLVLPPTTLRQVKEVAAAVRHRHLVYAQWGFEKRIAAGKGLKVLFAGTPGTGKTMTAGIMARDLGLDLYKIDLSGVVSKYIGETEKNLDLIFRAAHASNAILFFDEADALFGKRSEVKDAHDRYANIEISYLLQKMEEHEGAVVLATNLRKNIDEAFSRRMHYVVEFPMPDVPHREKLWRGMFPSSVPLGENVDFRFLARQFPLTGGDIQNVALDAAFLAAQNGRIVTMKQLINAMARQLRKQGRMLSASDFKQYHALITRTA